VHFVDDIQTTVSLTSQYKQRSKGSNERGTQLLVDSHKGIIPKQSIQEKMSQQKNVSKSNLSGGGGDKNTPQGKIKSPHKLQVKRKIRNSQREEEEQPISENDISLEDMDPEVDNENIQFLDEE
jgi:hypothetical protein